MRTVVVLEYDFSNSDELETIVSAIRQEVPARSLCAIRLATGDVADRIVESFVIEGQEKKP